MLTVEILNKITREGNNGTVNPAYVKQFVDDCNSLLPRFGIDTNKAVAIFLANVLHESGNLRIMEENLNYSAKRLRQVWPSRFKTDAIAQKYANNPQALANFTYANRMGNGNEASGDGWKYRGRSIPQLTGKDAYREIGKIMGLDLVNQPHLLVDRQYAVLCACAFWLWKKIKVTPSSTIQQVAKIWNGGTNGMDERVRLYNAAMKYLPNASVAKPVENNPYIPTGDIPVPTPKPVVPDVLANRGDDNGYVKQAQERLQKLGYGLDADGKFGLMTRDAIMAFQADNGLTPTPDVLNQETYHAIMVSNNMKPSKELLASVTAKELKQMGSEPVKQADNIQKAGLIGAGFATVKGVTDVLPEDTFTSVDGFMGQFQVLKGIVSSLGEIWQWVNVNWWVVVVLIAIAVFLYAKNIKKTTVNEYKDGVRNKA